MKKIAVFLGASYGNDSIYKQKAEELAQKIVEKGYTLVYGGSKTGLMGVLAKKVHELGGNSIGVTSENLIEEMIEPKYVTELYKVPNIDLRKRMMIDKADCVLCLPGGTGTLEELAQVLSWNKLNLTNRPMVLYNINQYYDGLYDWMTNGCNQGFVKKEEFNRLAKLENVNHIFDWFEKEM